MFNTLPDGFGSCAGETPGTASFPKKPHSAYDSAGFKASTSQPVQLCPNGATDEACQPIPSHKADHGSLSCAKGTVPFAQGLQEHLPDCDFLGGSISEGARAQARAPRDGSLEESLCPDVMYSGHLTDVKQPLCEKNLSLNVQSAARGAVTVDLSATTRPPPDELKNSSASNASGGKTRARKQRIEVAVVARRLRKLIDLLEKIPPSLGTFEPWKRAYEFTTSFLDDMAFLLSNNAPKHSALPGAAGVTARNSTPAVPFSSSAATNGDLRSVATNQPFRLKESTPGSVSGARERAGAGKRRVGTLKRVSGAPDKARIGADHASIETSLVPACKAGSLEEQKLCMSKLHADLTYTADDNRSAICHIKSLGIGADWLWGFKLRQSYFLFAFASETTTGSL